MPVEAAANGSPVTLDVSEGIAVLTLNRPDVLNALNTALIADFRGALRDVAADKAIRALLLTGAGKAFCAGADLRDPVLTDYGDDKRAGSRAIMAKWINPLVIELRQLPCPTIAAVNGMAVGGGIGLALAADIVIAARSAAFVQVFVPKLGLIPDMGTTWHMTRTLGPARARALAMLGEPISAQQAMDWGLIWKAVDDGLLLEQARSVAERLRDGPPLALQRVSRCIDSALENDFTSQIEIEADHQSSLNTTHDALEGILAFREKRKPVFRGR